MQCIITNWYYKGIFLLYIYIWFLLEFGVCNDYFSEFSYKIFVYNIAVLKQNIHHQLAHEICKICQYDLIDNNKLQVESRN